MGVNINGNLVCKQRKNNRNSTYPMRFYSIPSVGATEGVQNNRCIVTYRNVPYELEACTFTFNGFYKVEESRVVLITHHEYVCG